MKAPGWDKLQEYFPAKLFSIAEVNCRFIDMHPSLHSIINVFHNKIYRPFPTTAIHTNKNELDPHFTFSGTKGGNFSFKSIQKVYKHWNCRKGWEKESTLWRVQDCKIWDSLRLHLNLTIRCLRFYNLAPHSVLDPMFLWRIILILILQNMLFM